MYSEVGSDMSLEIVAITLKMFPQKKNHQNWLVRNKQISSFKGPENHNIRNIFFRFRANKVIRKQMTKLNRESGTVMLELQMYTQTLANARVFICSA